MSIVMLVAWQLPVSQEPSVPICDGPPSEVAELPASEAVWAPALQVRSEVRRVVDNLRQITESGSDWNRRK